ncbi:hypothetical protein GF413_00150, partial [Candidatus Micrarchaeota archaeon]|nr:hypothetical protein [Candidatus Micrarchaeota archaeon]
MKTRVSFIPIRTVVLLALVMFIMFIWGENRSMASDLGQQLSQAAADGDVRRVKELLEQGADPNNEVKSKTPPLEWAVIGGNNDIVKLLICYGAQVNHRNPAGTTALWRASQLCSVDIVRTLLCFGADPNIVGMGDQTALWIACHHAMIDPDPSCPESCLNGNLEVIQMLVQYGANVNHSINGVTIAEHAKMSTKRLNKAIRDYYGKVLAVLQGQGVGKDVSKAECPELECEKKCKLIAEAKHPIIPAHQKYYNQLTVKLECPEDQEKAEHKVKLETHFHNGHLVETKGASNPERNLELTMLPGHSKDVFYH